ncbi:MAG: hypothetical protein RBQ71_03235 [Acholeplasmataceae bacterium]|jgi:hypothetical protein|nr:hypothetical protein [Acholeplasmataceae bacterium]
MMSWILFGLSGLWFIINIVWMIVLFIRKRRQLSIPQEIKFQIKKTMRINIVYVIIFSILGFLFL